MVMTPRQREVYDFLCRFVEAKGYAPTIAEIQAEFGLSSPASVHQLISVLEREGLIRRIPHASRGIELIDKETDQASGSQIPLLGIVAAGRPIEAILTNEMMAVPPDMLGNGRTFALKVRGDSMIEEHIADGDFIVVESRGTASNGEMVVALIDGSDATVKRFFRNGDSVRLQPANSAYEPILISPADRVVVQGVVRGLIRRYRH